VIFDPIVAAIETSFDAHKGQHVRSVLAGLAALSEEEDAAIAMVGHLNTAPSTDAYVRVANAVAFWNASRSVVLITEDGSSDGTGCGRSRNDLRSSDRRFARGVASLGVRTVGWAGVPECPLSERRRVG
jgi:hypothetical protein